MSIPGAASPLFLATTGAADAFEISRSLRFSSGDSSFLNRTPSSAGNRKTWTWSGWVKRSVLGSQKLFIAGASGTEGGIQFHSGTDNTSIRFYDYQSGAHTIQLDTTQLFRDVAGWYHIVGAIDTTQATASDRAKLYINGVQVTSFATATYPSQNLDTLVNNNIAHYLGWVSSEGSYFNGYLAEVNFIDGQALDSSSFGEFDANGVWQAKDTAGLTFGTNGFRLKFADNSSSAALGTDSSSNSNTWTVNNIDPFASIGLPSGLTGSGFSGTLSDIKTDDGSGITATVSHINFDLGASYTVGTVTAKFLNASGSASANYRIELHGNSSYSNLLANSATVNAPSSGAVQTIVHDFSSTSARYLRFSYQGGGRVATLRFLSTTGATSGNAGCDSLVDSPTNGTQTDTGVGNEVVGNYATLNPLGNIRSTNANVGEIANLSNGNLTCTGVTNKYGHATSTIAIPSSGKYYFEVTSEITSDYINIGIASIVGTIDGVFETSTDSRAAWYSSSGPILIKVPGSETTVTTATQYRTTGGVIGVAVDVTNQEIKFYLNGTLKSTLSSLPAALISKLTAGEMFAYITAYNSAVGHINFGQRAFAYSAPTNFKSLNTANLPTPTIADGSKYFDTKLFTGTGANQAITGYNFSPSFAWIKARNNTHYHVLIDKIRGGTKALFSNATNAEETEAGAITSFNSDGFNAGDWGPVSTSGNTFVSWAWDAGANSNKTYAITVANPGSGNKFYADGALQPTLTLAEGSTYKFDQSNSSNASHPLRFSTTNNGTHGGGSEYTTGVTTAGTPGSAGAFTQIVIAASAPTLYAYCTAHSGMGFQINTSDKGGFTIPAGSLNSTAYDQSATWSGMVSPSPANGTLSQGFNGNLTNTFYGGISAGAYFTFAPTGGITFNTQIRVYNGNVSATSVKINGGSSVSLSTSSWTTVATGSGTLNTLAITRGTTDVHGWFGIEIDGKLLVDSGVSVANVPSIASQVMASPESGFSIIKYTGNNTSGATVGHGLNAAVEFAIFKQVTVTNDWSVYSKAAGATGYLRINTRDPFTTTSGQFNNTNPSSSVITLGGDHNANGPSNEIICYAFAPVTGYSSMGSYVGNASPSDAPFVYTGFKIRWLLIKGTTTDYREWVIYDTARDSYNVANKFLYANSSAAEASGNNIDLLSNGFKPRGGDYTHNKAGETYVYIAIASNPFASNGGLAR